MAALFGFDTSTTTAPLRVSATGIAFCTAGLVTAIRGEIGTLAVPTAPPPARSANYPALDREKARALESGYKPTPKNINRNKYMSTQLNNLLGKEVSRKEFLGMSGLAIASIFGFGTILKLLTGGSVHNNRQTTGYGSSAYGGSTEG